MFKDVVEEGAALRAVEAVAGERHNGVSKVRVRNA